MALAGLANGGNALVQLAAHRSIGASTAVFTALGLVAALAWAASRRQSLGWARALRGACRHRGCGCIRADEPSIRHPLDVMQASLGQGIVRARPVVHKYRRESGRSARRRVTTNKPADPRSDACSPTRKGCAMQLTHPMRILPAVAVMVMAVPAMAASYRLTPTDDTFAYSGEPDTAHGALSGLATGFTWPHAEAGWITYLKFDLGAIPADEVITGATLHLYKFMVGAGYASIGTNLFRFGNDAWTEDSLTWNNQPLGISGSGVPNFGTLVGSSPDGFTYVGWSSWDLFQQSAWNPAPDQADGMLSLQLAEMYGGDQSHNWCSKESDPTYCPAQAGHQPYLDVTTSAVPLPAALWLGVTACLSLVGRARRRRG